MPKKKKKKTASPKGISPRDFETGLSSQQLQAAKLLADGWSIPKTAEAVGCHYNTVRNWRKNLPAFRRVIDNYVPTSRRPVAVLPMKELTPEELDERMVLLVAPAVDAMAWILGSPDANDMAKVSVSKFVMSTMYQRLVNEADIAPKAVAELKEALRIIK